MNLVKQEQVLDVLYHLNGRKITPFFAEQRLNTLNCFISKQYKQDDYAGNEYSVYLVFCLCTRKEHKFKLRCIKHYY